MSEVANQNVETGGEYITHHLHHLQSTAYAGKAPLIDLHTVNLDTMFWAWFAGLCAMFFLYKAARKATNGVPGRLQTAVEMVVEMVDEQARNIVHGNRTFIAPLALTIFTWIIFMNAIDLFPVDWFPRLAGMLGLHYMRAVPTADINGTLGMSFAVFLLMIFYGLKVKGVGGFTHELFVAPFGTSKNPLFAVILGVINFAMQMVEYAAKTLSLGLRLFGNMYGGELVFMLIALLGATAHGFDLGSILGFTGAVIAGTAWAIFHILIVVLQAFIFMMLTLVYLGQSHDAH